MTESNQTIVETIHRKGLRYLGASRKSALLHLQKFESVENFNPEFNRVNEYLNDSHNKRIKTKRKGSLSALHRQQALGIV